MATINFCCVRLESGLYIWSWLAAFIFFLGIIFNSISLNNLKYGHSYYEYNGSFIQSDLIDQRTSNAMMIATCVLGLITTLMVIVGITKVISVLLLFYLSSILQRNNYWVEWQWCQQKHMFLLFTKTRMWHCGSSYSKDDLYRNIYQYIFREQFFFFWKLFTFLNDHEIIMKAVFFLAKSLFAFTMDGIYFIDNVCMDNFIVPITDTSAHYFDTNGYVNLKLYLNKVFSNVNKKYW